MPKVIEERFVLVPPAVSPVLACLNDAAARRQRGEALPPGPSLPPEVLEGLRALRANPPKPTTALRELLSKKS